MSADTTQTMVCINCPRGCTLTVTGSGEDFTVTGNFCPKGVQFARDELTAPKRTICSTVKTVFPETPVLPCRVSAEIPKEKIFDVMAEINQMTVHQRLARGDTIIKNVCGLGVDIIATSDILKAEPGKETML